MEVWNHFHTFLSLGSGDCEDHAILLCSLLIGFGLDAYVCVGTVREPSGGVRDHVWVITRSRRGGSASKPRVVFWETLTGQRYPHRLLTASRSGVVTKNGVDDDDTTPNYQVIGCAFNHRSFYANKQTNDSVALCNFSFEDERCWKGMDSEIMIGLEHQEKVPLCPPTISPMDLEVSMEHAIRHMVTSLRRNELRLSTDWDDQLSYMLGKL
jgi:centrosomal protein CEP76